MSTVSVFFVIVLTLTTVTEATIECTGGEIKLEKAVEGDDQLLLTCHKGNWGAVCDEAGSFGEVDAEVVCYNLSFSGEKANGYHCKDSFKPEHIWWKNITCSKTDESFQQCSKERYDYICSDNYYACVTCSGETQVQLKNTTGHKDHKGRVQHYYHGQWNELCIDDWTWNDSMVVCRQLGMGIPLNGSRSVEPLSSVTFIFSDINCTGSEGTLKECKTEQWQLEDSCSGPMVPWVICEGPEIRSPEVTPTSPHSVKVKWSINQAVLLYPIVTGYQIQYTNTHKLSVKQMVSSNQQITDYSVDVGGLQASTQYNFTVRAVMGEHKGPTSAVVPVTTDSDNTVAGLSAGIVASLIFGIFAGVIISIIIFKTRNRIGNIICHPCRCNWFNINIGYDQI